MKVGFIGPGTMGKPLALNLVRANHNVMVYDVRAEPVEELKAAGAASATTCS